MEMEYEDLFLLSCQQSEITTKIVNNSQQTGNIQLTNAITSWHKILSNHPLMHRNIERT